MIQPELNHLNDLCRSYVDKEEEFNRMDEVREIFKTIKVQGYEITNVVLQPTSPEFDLLSEVGKEKLETLIRVRFSKVQAINNQEYETGAQLRDKERRLHAEILYDLWLNNNHQYFINVETVTNLIVFVDPDNQLSEIFKLQ